MSIYWQLLRLHLLWFILYNLICIFIFLKSGDARLALIIKVVGYPAINLISRPFSRRFDDYFRNMGYDSRKLFFNICLVDLLAFIVLIIPLIFLF